MAENDPKITKEETIGIRKKYKRKTGEKKGPKEEKYGHTGAGKEKRSPGTVETEEDGGGWKKRQKKRGKA